MSLFRHRLESVKKELDKMTSKENAIQRCIQKRLDASLSNYEDDLVETCSYLLSRNNGIVVRNIARENRKDIKNYGRYDK